MPSDRFDSLSIKYPIVFFPIRIETRYFTLEADEAGRENRTELRIRVFPDAILANAHEPLLSEKEKRAGEHYWRTTFSAYEESKEEKAWAALTMNYKSPRAAWIVRQTLPLNYEQFAERRLNQDETLLLSPRFRNIATRPENERKKVRAELLPDYWIALNYENEIIGTSRPIQKPLSLAMNWQASERERADWDQAPRSELTSDPEVNWVFDFERAEEVGMAMRIPQENLELRKRLRRLIVFGVNTSLDAEASAEQIERLIDQHHYTRGFSFLKQGTPTNNTEEVSSPYPSPDPGGKHSFQIERKGFSLHSHTDGKRLADALGIQAHLFSHIEGADKDEQSPARTMVQALWPVSLGYMMRPTPRKLSLSDDLRINYDDFINVRNIWSNSESEFYDHMMNYVRGRGPFSAFRIGSVPYGFLPVAYFNRAFDSVHPDIRTARTFEFRLTQSLNSFEDWKSFRAYISKKRDGQFKKDPYLYFLDVISRAASAREVYFRVINNVHEYVAPGRPILPGQIPGIGEKRDMYGFNLPPLRFEGGLVDFKTNNKETLSETNQLTHNYINWITKASIDELMNENYRDLNALPEADREMLKKPPLLYLLLWQAMLTEYIRIGMEIVKHERNESSEEEQSERERRTRELMEYRLYAPSGDVNDDKFEENIYDYLDNQVVIGRVPVRIGSPEMREIRASLRDVLEQRTRTPVFIQRISGLQAELQEFKTILNRLAALPTAELERLFTETLDVFSYRLDAWFTSLAVRYLNQARADRPRGCYMGAFGWVENLEPSINDLPADLQPQKVEIEGEEEVYTVSGNAGFIYAPSMRHAGTAAVLRNAYLEFDGSDSSVFSINLSSQRARQALLIIDSIRERQPLSASLGYLFERSLHDAELDRYIDDFRDVFPLTAKKMEDSDEATDSLAARNVVDGYKLTLCWQSRNEKPFPIEDIEEVEPHLEALEDALDAVSDLLMAESIYQMLGGNAAGAQAALKATSEGRKPPSPEVVKTPRSGKSVNYKVVLSFSDSLLHQEKWVEEGTPRSRAAPLLNAWAANLLGDPEKIRAKVWFENEERAPITISFKDLQVEALDVLFLVKDYREGSPLPKLEDRIIWVVNAKLTGDEVVSIRKIQYYDLQGESEEFSFEEVFEAARVIHTQLEQARPLKPQDLILSETRHSITLESLNLELADRVEQSLREFKAGMDELRAVLVDPTTEEFLENPDPKQVLAACKPLLMYNHQSGDGILTSYLAADFSAVRTAAQELFEDLQNLWSKIENKREEIQQGRANDTLRPEEEMRKWTQITKYIFGSDFMLLPLFRPSELSGLQNLLNDQPVLGKGEQDSEGEREKEYARWFDQMALVRSNLNNWSDLEMYVHAFGHYFPRPDIIQAPYRRDAKWMGTALLEHENGRFPNRTESTILYRYPINAPLWETERWAGLIIDEWIEKIPNKEEDLGVAYHFDSPNNEAPQAVLLAAPPLINILEGMESWTSEFIVNTLSQTFEMMISRLADGEYQQQDGKVRNSIYDAKYPKFPMTYFHTYYYPDAVRANRIKDLEDCLTDDLNNE